MSLHKGSGSDPLRAGAPEGKGSRRPGPAVLLILFYALAFAAGLWLFRTRSPLFHKTSSLPPMSPEPRVPAVVSRATLLSAPELPSVARSEYFRLLSAECCTCGCDLTLGECLVTDQNCTRSPPLAQALFDQFR